MDWASRIRTPSFESAERSFLEAVEAFRQWASEQPVHAPPGEWETLYDDWPSLNTAFIRFIQASSVPQWKKYTIDALLYTLARDSEAEIIKDDLIDKPEYLLVLAREGLNYDDPDARWQLADALGSENLANEHAEPLLERFVRDDDEYVSRRALLALSRRGYRGVEQLAVRAWATGLEYQRIAALHVLAECSSPLLASYLEIAIASEGDHLKANARELAASLADRGS